MNEETHQMMNMVKMKMLFSSNNEIYTHLYQCIITILIMFLMNYITSIFSQDTNQSGTLLDNNISYKIKSLFVKETKIEIEGRRCFKSGVYAYRHDNLFSFSFNAIWQYVDNKIIKNNKDDIYSIKECGETNNVYDEYTEEVKTDTKTTYIVNQQKPFYLERGIYCRVNVAKEKMESVSGNNKITTNVENIKIVLFSYTQKMDVLKDFLENTTKQYITTLDDSRIGKYFIYTYEGGNNDKKTNEYDGNPYLKLWSECEFKTNTTFKNIFFKQKNELLNKINFFIHNKDWYAYHGKPYTLGIGLSGPPGTGKTSIIKSIAHDLKRHIVVIPLNKITTISEFTRVFYENRYIKSNKENSVGFKDKIIIFEDIDCMTDIVFSRDDTFSEVQNLKEMMSRMKPTNTADTLDKEMITTIIKACKEDNYELLPNMKTPDNDKLTLSFILNVIDGIKETPGRIIIITSNHYNKLDKALIRPGRIDICLEMELASIEIIEEMFHYFYKYSSKNELVSWKETINTAGFEMNDIPDKVISQAEVVQCFDSDPVKFIENIMEKKTNK